MATYRNNNTENVDTFSGYADGKPSGKVGHIRFTTLTIEAENFPGALRILSGDEAGRYVKKNGFSLVTMPPPPPPPPSDSEIAYLIGYDDQGNIVGFFDRRNA